MLDRGGLVTVLTSKAGCRRCENSMLLSLLQDLSLLFKTVGVKRPSTGVVCKFREKVDKSGVILIKKAPNSFETGYLSNQVTRMDCT
ncbi:hypothetical protein AVEN_159009-1 [Araneus ventricosus]|uniref:Uncharacterized protein n=1 Tax=Araneus ventricosus TaxID=182803 RepID=A0A4Y2BAX4_ARAVE|nr:hypothetical protein AVEN_159009-1 [Araneus ventricosus]